jgi:hypothetical protein
MQSNVTEELTKEAVDAARIAAGADPIYAEKELAEVWCANDTSNAIHMVNGVAVCATCFVPAYAEARKAARA